MTTLLSVLPRMAATLTIAALAVATVDGRVVRGGAIDETSTALLVFEQRVAAYAELHRALAASLLPPGTRHLAAISTVPLASAIKTARATAGRGDIFTSEAARFFRAIIRGATSATDFELVAPLMDEDGRLLPGVHPGIHAPLPIWDARELPASTLFMLPTLPPELEYRIVDYDLVLWDVRADLIVDVLAYALPYPSSDAMYR